MEVARNEIEIKQALREGRISEGDVENWRKLLTTGGKYARETLRSLAPDLWAKEFGTSYSESIESVPDNVRNVLTKLKLPEDKIVTTYQKSKIHEIASREATMLGGGI